MHFFIAVDNEVTMQKPGNTQLGSLFNMVIMIINGDDANIVAKICSNLPYNCTCNALFIGADNLYRVQKCLK